MRLFRGGREVLKRLAQWLAGNAGSAAVGAIVALGVAWGVDEIRGDTPSISSQLDTAISDAAHDGKTVVFNRELDLRGTGGKKARVLVFRRTRRGKSDELRIYEEAKGRLQVRLSVEPATRRFETPFQIRIVGSGRYDATDREELLFSFDPQYADTRLVRPVALIWNALEGSYDVHAVLPNPPNLIRARPRTFAAGLHRTYKPIDIPLVGGAVLRRIGGAHEVLLRRSQLATAYVGRQECNACPGIWEFKVWTVDFENPRLTGTECGPYTSKGPRRVLRRVKKLDDIRRGMLSALRVGSCL